MNLLLDFLKSRRSVRWLGHALGILAGGGLVLLVDGTFASVLHQAMLCAIVLLVVELLLSLADLKQRRLVKLAPDCFPLKNMAEAERAFVQDSLAASPRTAMRRMAGAWMILVAVPALEGSPTLRADLLFASLALPVAVLTAGWGGDLLLKRLLPFFYYEGEYAYADNLAKRLPSLGARLRRSALMPLLVLMAPLSMAFVTAQPLSLASLLWMAGWAAVAGLAAVWVLDSLALEPMAHLKEALRRFGRGDLQALLDVTGGDEIGQATETYNKTLRAVDRRFFVLENFGHAVLPGKSDALFEGGLRLDGEKRTVALLECRWHNAADAAKDAEAPAQLAALNRFYEVVQDAVDKSQGSTLELGDGRVLAAWGAPLADEATVQGALTAAWSLQAHLKVWATQTRVRGGQEVHWGLGVAHGQVTAGLIGPKQRQRYAVMGGPRREVAELARRIGGPWLDERSTGAVKAPFAVQIGAEVPQLIGGPEPEVPAMPDLGFSPGQRL